MSLPVPYLYRSFTTTSCTASRLFSNCLSFIILLTNMVEFLCRSCWSRCLFSVTYMYIYIAEDGLSRKRQLGKISAVIFVPLYNNPTISNIRPLCEVIKTDRHPNSTLHVRLLFPSKNRAKFFTCTQHHMWTYTGRLMSILKYRPTCFLH